MKNLDGTLSGTEITKTVPCAINCDYYCNVKTTGASGAVVPEVIMDTSGLGNNLMLSGFANTADSGYNKYGVLKLSGTETVKLDNPILFLVPLTVNSSTLLTKFTRSNSHTQSKDEAAVSV